MRAPRHYFNPNRETPQQQIPPTPQLKSIALSQPRKHPDHPPGPSPRKFPTDIPPVMAPTTLHLRAECKALEHRSALTPTTAKALIDAGFVVNVERSAERIFDDAEFEAVGATLVDEGSWPNVPKEHIIVGLKELPEEDCKSTHHHPNSCDFADYLKNHHI